MRMRGRGDSTLVSGREKLSFVAIPTSTSIIPGTRLCEWCGYATDSRGNCDGCGGYRTPLTELVDMEHKCTWCGGKTINGIVCQACGMRVQGTMLKEIINV